MKKTYKVSGMTCNGCRTSVENTLNEIAGVQAKVSLETGRAEVDTTQVVDTDSLQKALSKKGNYILQEIIIEENGQEKLLDRS